MKYKAIIFDMDGTITNSEKVWQQATKDLILNKGIQITDDIYAELEQNIRGLALHNSCSIIKNQFTLEHSLEELIAEKRNRAVELLKEGLTFIDGFERFHKKVVNEQILIGIATNADDYALQASKNALELDRYFGKHIYNISHVNNKAKPHPDLYLHVAKQLQIEPYYCIAFEDSAHGVRAAKRAGMFCVGINTAQDRAALHESDLIIDHYDEIELQRLLHRTGIKIIKE